MTGILIAVAGVVIFVVVVLFILSASPRVLRERAEKKRQQEEWRLQAEANRARWDGERREWNRKVSLAKRYLTGTNWRDHDGKIEFVQELWGGDKVPQYLWYEFSGLTAEETAECWKLFWPHSRPCLGDWEGHSMLRVRNAKVFLAEVMLSTGKVLVLEQVGHAQWWASGEGFPVGCVRFSRNGFYPNREPAQPVAVS